MTDFTFLLNLSINVSALTIVVLGLFMSLLSRNLDQRTRHFFSAMFGVLSLYILFHLTGYLSVRFSSSASLTRICIFLHSLFSSVLTPMLTMYMLLRCGEKPHKNRVFFISSCLWLVYLLMLIFTQFTNAFYFITPENSYQRGPLYPLFLIPLLLIMAVTLIALIHRRNRFSRATFCGFLIYILMPAIGILLQLFFYGLLAIIFGTALAAAVLFINIYNDQVDESLRQQEENSRLETSAAMLQMRPHFIYNVMTSIYYLIQQDPKRAQQVTLDFTNYLRRNFTAITKKETIPFTSELEHTQAYLSVELVRFEGKLLVEFDTPHTEFRLPPLTLQPIVENAVKHGIDPERGPLHLSVKTRKTEDGSTVIIADDGSGFKMADNGEPHVALENIRKRLSSMCGGTLGIRTVSPSGTEVQIFIPKQ